MKLEFGQYFNELGAELECPGCQGNYLHHERIEVFDRVEDATSGLHITVDDGNVGIDTSLSGNPSSRRHGLSIYLSCETCEATFVLAIAQHKGQTYIDIRKPR